MVAVPGTSRALVARVAVAPWVRRALLLFAVSRVASTGLFLLAAALAQPGSKGRSRYSIVHLMARWDGGWYRTIVQTGYPTTLPTVDGRVAQNAWAFLPAYPAIVRALSFGSPGLIAIVAELVAAAFGAGSVVLLVLLLKRHVGERRALTAAAVYALGPVGYVLQIAYADSMGLFLIFAILCLLDRHRYLPAVPLVLLLGLTRPGAQAVALAVGLHLLVRIRRDRTGEQPFGPRAWAPPAVLLVAAVGSGFVWPWIAGLVTGRADAYVATENAWRYRAHDAAFEPFQPWILDFERWFGFGGSVLLLPLALIVVGALLGSRRARSLGSTALLWVVSWLAYLLLIGNPAASLIRLLMPIAPAGALLEPRNRWQAGLLVLVLLALQAYWLLHAYALGPDQWITP